MKITSSAFGNNSLIPIKYTCSGDDINPPLEISAVPSATKSLALIVDDPDSPTGTWTHWLVWNIDPTTTEIDENSIPAGATEGTTSFGQTHYGGPCPGNGEHRYFFKLYALNNNLDLTSPTTQTQLEAAIKDHIIDQGQLMGRYSK